MQNEFQHLKFNGFLSKYSDSLVQFYRKLFGLKGNGKLVSIVNTTKSDITFLTDNDSYVTYFYINGLANDPTFDTLEAVSTKFNEMLAPFISIGHKFHDCISSTQDNAHERLRHILRGRNQQAASIGMSCESMDEALITMVHDFVFFEERMVCLETPNVSELYVVNSAHVKHALPDVPLTESYRKSVEKGVGDKLLQPHMLYVEAFRNFLNDPRTQIDGHPLSHDEAMVQMKGFTEPHYYSASKESKSPLLAPVETADPGEHQLDSLLGKDYSSALFSDTPKLHPLDNNIVKVGNRIYKSVIVDAFAPEFRVYNDLHSKLLEKKIHYRMKTSIGGNPVDKLKAEYAASKFALLPSQREFLECFKTIYFYSKDHCIPMIQQTFTTWVDGDDAESVQLLNTKAEEMLNVIRAWSGGGHLNKAHIDNVTPLHTFYSSLPCTTRSVGAKIPLPLVDCSQRLPMFRPAFPYDKAGNNFVISKDGKILNFDFLEGRTAYISFIVGSMGTGKTVFLMNQRNDLMFRRSNNKLPYQINIDIGGNLETDTNLYKEESPSFADAIQYVRVTNDLSNKKAPRINLFSTPLGLRKLPAALRSSIISLISDRLNGFDGTELPQSLEMTGDALDSMYERFARRETGKKILLEDIYGLKTILRKHDFKFLESSSMAEFTTESLYFGWDVVDFLILKGEHSMAYQVQNKCTPLLSDLVSVANESDWQRTWNHTIHNIPIGKLFVRKLYSMIDMYPFVSRESNFNIWDKHILTFELSEVIQKGGSPSDKYQSRFWFSLIFIYIRALLGADPETIEKYKDQIKTEQKYRDEGTVNIYDAIVAYQAAKISHITSSKRRAVVDEIHRFMPTNPNEYGYAADVLDSLLNEIRRSGIELSFASPEPEHGAYFNKKATLIAILGFTSDHQLQACKQCFNLSDYELVNYVAKLKLNPQKGVNAYLILRDVGEISNVKEFKHSVYFPVPMIEIWRYANRFIEKNIRSRVVEEYGVEDGFLILAGALPRAGSSKDLDRIENQLINSGSLDEIDDPNSEEGKEKKDRLIADKILDMIKKNPQHFIDQGLRSVYGKDISRKAS